MNADTTTCPTCGTPITAEVLGGKCPTCLRKVALAEPTLVDETALMPRRAATPPAVAWEPPSVEALAALLPAGAYTVESLIGRGGMGAVYKGTQRSLKRAIAIKLMRQDQGADFRERFLREAHTLARLNHPGIVNVIDCGEVGSDLLYIVMEFVDGADLMEVIRSGGMTQARALQVLPQICEALQFAHDHGIVHRDIKPSNILLTRAGRVKVADFGLAKAIDPDSSVHTGTGSGLGTPDYAAPEQFTPGAEVDHRADIYALGVMIYQMITGQLPRGAWKPPSEKADVDAQWDKIVSHALQTDPQERYASVSEIQTDISSISQPVSGQGGGAGSAISQGGRPPQGSTTARTQAGGRSATGAQTPAPPRSKKSLRFGLAGALMIAAGGYFAWNKFPADVTPISATNPVATAAPTLPAPIRLWDAADKIPKQTGVSWEDDALRLDSVPVSHHFPTVHRVAVKTSIRVNPDTDVINLSLWEGFGDARLIFWYVNFQTASLGLQAKEGPEKIRDLGAWKMPRQYRPGDWLPVELRVDNGEISLSLEGKLLGTVRDSTFSEFKTFAIWGKSHVHLRDVEVVPLDPSWPDQPQAAPATPVTVTVTNIPQRPVPKPAVWVDATPQVRDAVVKAGAGTVQGDWLVLSKQFWTDLSDRKILRNVVVRMSFKGVAGMTLRGNSEKKLSYQCYLLEKYVRLHGYNGAANAIACFNQSRSLDAGFDLLAEHEMVMAAEGDLISLWLDGRLMLSQRDSTIAQGRIGVSFTPADASLLPHLRKLEYADLGDTPVTPVEVAKPAPPAPIRLWDAADKIPKRPGVSWEDDALRLDKVSVHHLSPVVHRVAFKTSIRVNPDTEGVNLSLLQRARDAGNYYLNVNFAAANLNLYAIEEKADKQRPLKSWQMPRQYRPGEWLPVELRLVDGEISVSLEGKLLGIVHDSTFSDFTAFAIWGTSYAHFRDSEVVPLDPSWPNQPQAASATPATPATVIVTDIPQRPVPKPDAWVDATSQVRDAVVKAGAGAVQGDWLVLSKSFFTLLSDRKVFRNAVVRMSFKGEASMSLRTSPISDFRYTCVLNMDRTLCLFSYALLTSTRVHFDKVAKLAPDFDLLAEHELVMAAEDDLISVWLDGRLMLSQRDSNIARGYAVVDFKAAESDASIHPHVKKVEYADLGGAPSAARPEK